MIKTCAFSECGQEFFTAKHNQIYCCSDHRKQATSQRYMAKYYEDKAWRDAPVRICRTPGCQTRMSRYNTSRICAKCQAETAAAERNRLMELFK